MKDFIIGLLAVVTSPVVIPCCVVVIMYFLLVDLGRALCEKGTVYWE